MTAGTHSFTIEQGATWTRTLNISGRDLTGATARMQLRKTPGTALIAELTTENGKMVLTIVDTDNATLTLTLTATETAALSFIQTLYDLEIVFTTGEVLRLLSGTFTLTKEITV